MVQEGDNAGTQGREPAPPTGSHTNAFISAAPGQKVRKSHNEEEERRCLRILKYPEPVREERSCLAGSSQSGFSNMGAPRGRGGEERMEAMGAHRPSIPLAPRPQEPRRPLRGPGQELCRRPERPVRKAYLRFCWMRLHEAHLP